MLNLNMLKPQQTLTNLHRKNIEVFLSGMGALGSQLYQVLKNRLKWVRQPSTMLNSDNLPFKS